MFEISEVPASLLDCFEEIEVQCGAPWERVVEKTSITTRPIPAVIRQDASGKVCGDPGRHVTTTKTTGWNPTCTCFHGPGHAAPVPCTVCDPFMGSGTVAEVARQNGCRAIGIELNGEYIALAAKRLEQGSLF